MNSIEYQANRSFSSIIALCAAMVFIFSTSLWGDTNKTLLIINKVELKKVEDVRALIEIRYEYKGKAKPDHRIGLEIIIPKDTKTKYSDKSEQSSHSFPKISHTITPGQQIVITGLPRDRNVSHSFISNQIKIVEAIMESGKVRNPIKILSTKILPLKVEWPKWETSQSVRREKYISKKQDKVIADDKELNKLYKILKGTANKKLFNDIRKTQVLWIKERDANCNMVLGNSDKHWVYGIGKDIKVLRCIEWKTEKRIRTLNKAVQIAKMKLGRTNICREYSQAINKSVEVDWLEARAWPNSLRNQEIVKSFEGSLGGYDKNDGADYFYDPVGKIQIVVYGKFYGPRIQPEMKLYIEKENTFIQQKFYRDLEYVPFIWNSRMYLLTKDSVDPKHTAGGIDALRDIYSLSGGRAIKSCGN